MADQPLELIERAMVAVRRSQTRRTLSLAAGVTSAGFDVLDVVEAAEQSGTPATVAAVAEALAVDQPRASKLVATAVQVGLVRRQADQTDGRRSFLVLTEEGRTAVAEISRFRRDVFAAAMRDWPESDRAEFARLLHRFVSALPARPSPTNDHAP
ncbi:MarR family winged helix-turn-helix transcriptional regulator [Rhizohabitans arisaemae]|uniref:MarR family winged helix-turn-helix transcriptional regulator n=1 Tax=Rhizohabitans arisaemae TaxID=2720610 RepID=UPI0024B0A0A7|nr:MarR family winged helix-turn-helix transcriptional regulator [Rhizohabitans arisaemae]